MLYVENHAIVAWFSDRLSDAKDIENLNAKTICDFKFGIIIYKHLYRSLIFGYLFNYFEKI